MLQNIPRFFHQEQGPQQAFSSTDSCTASLQAKTDLHLFPSSQQQYCTSMGNEGFSFASQGATCIEHQLTSRVASCLTQPKHWGFCSLLFRLCNDYDNLSPNSALRDKRPLEKRAAVAVGAKAPRARRSEPQPTGRGLQFHVCTLSMGTRNQKYIGYQYGSTDCSNEEILCSHSIMCLKL